MFVSHWVLSKSVQGFHIHVEVRLHKLVYGLHRANRGRGQSESFLQVIHT